MNHVDRSKWRSYIEGNLPDEEMIVCEEHLYDCDDCMSLYMECLEESDQAGTLDAVRLPDVEGLTERIMADVRSHAMLEWKSSDAEPETLSQSAPPVTATVHAPAKPRSLFRKTFFHYVIAASITLLLMSTGVFHQLIANSMHLTQAASTNKQPLSQQLLEKTDSIFTTWSKKR